MKNKQKINEDKIVIIPKKEVPKNLVYGLCEKNFMTPKQNKPSKEWEEEWDIKFGGINKIEHLQTDRRWLTIDLIYQLPNKEIKQFIRQLLTKELVGQKERIIKEIINAKIWVQMPEHDLIDKDDIIKIIKSYEK